MTAFWNFFGYHNDLGMGDEKKMFKEWIHRKEDQEQNTWKCEAKDFLNLSEESEK